MDDESANIIMWSSAERPATFIQMEHLTPSEVKRLIESQGGPAADDHQLRGARRGRQGHQERLDADVHGLWRRGDVHPSGTARHPKVTWDQEWFARVSFKAVRMDMISPEGVMDFGGMSGGGSSDTPATKLSDEEYCAQLAAKQASKPTVADAIPGGRLLGRFGRKKKPADAPVDPRCAPKK